ncbi:hypothetical protein Pm5461_114 [Proteus phage vB_PmiM_Pm5461]|uniref:Trimeric autotransporter adhesin YadA-like C-terminal membrane anchor domain-containing protein n=1 Tax=Proteus phage vB_PmiM_Pm5461 TaxID=1636250 RepID=A0A0G2SS75_9CAUD|nr:hypothetical protein AVT59_gp117 [Proteus phage vB_PmiM_Pm5461]AKA61979.1 hypothetical protein Pm5461_114 [Proteus phage vB_PmiM_Pm5461]
MKYIKCMILLSSLLSFAAWSNFADYNDDKWISNGSHTYHDGTVTETMNRYISSSSPVYDKLYSAIAGTMAVTSIPIDYTKSFSIGVGVGGYKSGSALGVSVGGKPSDTNIIFKVNASFDNESNSSVGAGLSYGW